MKGIGIDIGGTNTKLIVVDEKGGLLHEERFPTLPARGYKDFIKRLAQSVKRLKQEWHPAAIGIGAAGDIDPRKGIMRFSPNLGRWRNVPIAGPLKKMTGLPVVIENDANMAAWGAYELELKKKYDDVLVVTLGTGIGGGLIVGGRLFHGGTGSAGEIGHNKIEPGGAPCSCGGKGCLEAYCGNYAIVREARKIIKNVPAFVKKYGAPGHAGLDPLCLTRAADAGHKGALKVWRDMGERLGRGLADMVLLFNPECLLLAGGVSRAEKYFLGPMKKVFAAQQIATPFKELKIVVARNADTGVYGAAMLGLSGARKK